MLSFLFLTTLKTLDIGWRNPSPEFMYYNIDIIVPLGDGRCRCPYSHTLPNTLKYLTYQLHAVSRIHHGRQRETGVTKFRSSPSSEFFEALRVKWRNSTSIFCLGAKAKK